MSWRAVTRCLLGLAKPSWQLVLLPMDLRKTRPIISQLWIREGFKGYYLSLLNYGLLMDARQVAEAWDP